jgi:phosphonate transport system ATP-binding protein
MLILEHLRKHFGATRAVDGVSLEVPRGQLVGVIGPSGAGKSTLLRLINRLAEPDGGRIRFDDVEVTRLRGVELRRWRARCAMIFQQFHLVPRLDVLTNVLIGRVSYHHTVPAVLERFTEAERALAVCALERMGLLGQAFQRADTLSGGQQQRVAIARALVQQPAVLLADEPVASLDPRNAARVMDLLAAINREEGITLVCNLHSLDIARRYCDRIVALDGGRLAFDGPPAELSADRVASLYDPDTGGAPEREALAPAAFHPLTEGVA